MKLKTLAIALAALSMAGAAAAADNSATSSNSSSSDAATTASQLPQSSSGSMAKDESTVREAQQALKEKGYDSGAIDGKWGSNTEKAVRSFQEAKNLPQSGELDQQTTSALGIQQGSSHEQSSQSSTMQSPGATPSTPSSTESATPKH